MSGIFGILNLDGQPTARENLDAMRSHMAYWGPHGSSTWQSENVGLGHLLLRSTPEAVAESLPLCHPASGIVLTAHARLDNRKDLMAHLSLPEAGRAAANPQVVIHNQVTAIPDGELILNAYLHWGEDCVQHLIGDWELAVWDPRERKLFLARDPCGVSSLYYYCGRRFFAFASCLKGLLALPEVPKRPNLPSLVQLLTGWGGDGGGHQTAYEGLNRLPAAHTLVVTMEQVKTRRYWFLENTPSLHLGSDDEYLEAFLEVYSEAVRCRLRTLPCASSSTNRGAAHGVGVGATLSSGLDSGSVCALAARELRSRGQRLPVFTAVPIYDTQSIITRGQYGDESSLVELDRRFIGNLDVHYIRAENASPLEGMRRDLELHDNPVLAASNMFWIYALLESVQQHGLGVLLVGQAGNGTISWRGGAENLWPRLLQGDWQTLWRQYQRSGLSPWQMVRRHLLRPIVLRTQRAIRYAAPWGLFGHEPWTAYSAINARWARSLNLAGRMKASGHDPFFTPLSDPRQAHIQLQYAAGFAGALWAEVGPAYGLEVRDPTADKRLITFCLAIPAEQYRLNKQDRALIRRAMQGLLPDEVRLNTRRGRQAADLYQRMLAELPQVQALLAQLEGSELARQVLDLPRMNRVLQELQKEVNVKTTRACSTILARGMIIGMFLLRFNDYAGDPL